MKAPAAKITLFRVGSVVAVMAAALMATAMLVSGQAGATSPVHLVSGPSAYADCRVRLVPDEVVYRNAEVEPWIAVDPTDPRHLVGVWQQDRLTTGGAKGLMAAVSFDRGRTWDRTTLPFDACAPGGLDVERASDPWVSIGPDGIVYAASLSLDHFGDGGRGIAVATSDDGGASWSDPRWIHNRQPESVFDDKEAITADPVRPGSAYATWTAYRPSSVPILFSRTMDGGMTWTKARVIYPTTDGEFTLSSQIVVDPASGTLYDFVAVSRDDRHWQKVIISRDAGATWSEPVKISRDFTKGTGHHPNTGEELRVGDQVPDAAVDPRNGDLYVVWQDSRFSGHRYDEIALSHSSDGGRSWSRPIRVNTPTGLPAFVPSVEVNGRGVVGVSYYDVREVGSATDTLPTDAWLVKLRDGGRRRAGEWKLAGPFDWMTAPEAFGRFLGDYEGLTVSGNRFAALFAIANDGRRMNRTDIVFALS